MPFAIRSGCEKAVAIILLIMLSPVFFVLFLIVRLTTKGSFLFRQKRMGKNMKIFTMLKIRTMVNGADSKKRQYLHLNEVDGPVFKIRNDPRYTTIGKFLSHSGLDELPQLINIIRGEMAFVGPRPLPVDEAQKVPKKYERRFSVLPGITSSWVIKGTHKLNFNEWMNLDLDYVKNNNLLLDLSIIFQTGLLILFVFYKKIIGLNKE